MKVYLVGGAVRDKLLGYPYQEKDWVVVGASPETLLDQGYRPVGNDFPVFLHPQTGEEYALARTERKSGVGYKGFQFCTDSNVTLEEDLSRRDLTINAMAQAEDGTLIDPYGGQEDLKNRVLRHVSNAFVEDPLRVLRVARFAARYAHLGFTIAPETMSLMTELSHSGELESLTPERVWMETEKALGERSPRTYIEVLRECGALKVLLPEVDRLFGVPQRADYHPEVDTGLHILMSLDQATLLESDPAVRFAVLMHDLGKGITPSSILPRHIGHEENGVKLVNGVCDRLKVPNRFRELAVAVTRHHLHCHKAPHLKASTTLRLLKEIGALRQADKLQQFVHCCEADARGRLGFEQREYYPGQWLQKAFAAIQNIDHQALINQGLSGKKLGDAIEQRRLSILNELREPCH
ncbi:multifunctional CCA addition/repair protein [Porticoccus litoralis]|uniref:Multifunctional CCA protein n=1 Tax=Porticoccus litoralis TaxID=434086 RepID=A0AAW8B4X2_9GAMM|nr:multifunctional CCA addition/repair protein [Porticoccus litoralis]MDP1521020.1 multifunctional CCA addition/repair protein [Porticoccus litoralis]